MRYAPAACKHDLLARMVGAFCLGWGAKRDACAGERVRGGESERGRVDLAGEEALGERRPLARRRGLVTDQRDGTGVALRTHRERRSATSLPGADDHHPRYHGFPPDSVAKPGTKLARGFGRLTPPADRFRSGLTSAGMTASAGLLSAVELASKLSSW